MGSNFSMSFRLTLGEGGGCVYSEMFGTAVIRAIYVREVSSLNLGGAPPISNEDILTLPSPSSLCRVKYPD
jgi:hypothetical protein